MSLSIGKGLQIAASAWKLFVSRAFTVLASRLLSPHTLSFSFSLSL